MDVARDNIRKVKVITMKKLNMFTYFDWESFAKDKRFISTSIQPLKDFTSGKVIGTKVQAVIAQDDTFYDNKDGEIISNIYEKLIFKVKKILIYL